MLADELTTPAILLNIQSTSETGANTVAAPTYQFANNANSILAAPINSVVTTLQVAAGTGGQFPTPVANQPFWLTLLDAATQQISEIVLVTQRVGDVFTIVRGQDGTTAKNWSGGDICANLVTAATVQNMEQIPQAQASAHNWAQDTGGVNSPVAAYTPAITQRIQGMTLRIKIANNNNGPCTLDAGAGPSPFLNPDGSDLGAGALIAGGWAEFVDNVTSYQLISSSQQAQSSAGAATTGDMKFRPTSETIAGWIIANATTIGNAASNATQRANADCANLFAWHWNNFANNVSPVFTSAGVPTTRGANAAAEVTVHRSSSALQPSRVCFGMRSAIIGCYGVRGVSVWRLARPSPGGPAGPCGTMLACRTFPASVASFVDSIKSGARGEIRRAHPLGFIGVLLRGIKVFSAYSGEFFPITVEGFLLFFGGGFCRAMRAAD